MGAHLTPVGVSTSEDAYTDAVGAQRRGLSRAPRSPQLPMLSLGFKDPLPVRCPWDLTFLLCKMWVYTPRPLTKFF